ncbi:hypothetical protein PUMCH_000045 [Australozyma saopauloensis]|uniref:NOT2/NOT3/NOT5 C-terminal domain-containing protein n=1 Tax=Australozyma saopauloensis TaxID=291208 RepID=A0AAX4H2V5_9ASCO|nr:hypothetical protein PUMCH_000045 [[Candida] saopauloensis]
MSGTLPPGLLSTVSQNAINNNSTPGPEVSPIERFGLAALPALIHINNNEKSANVLCQDVDLMGLDLSPGAENLKNMGSPWQETTRSEAEPYFSLPESILKKNIIPQPEPCGSKIQSFQDETLFYIFYSRPRDTIQEYAARELVTRNWRYHRDLQVWLTKDSNVDPQIISPDVERGVYIFFDPHNWEKIRKEFVLHYSSVQA